MKAITFVLFLLGGCVGVADDNDAAVSSETEELGCATDPGTHCTACCSGDTCCVRCPGGGTHCN
jgi:hypothetical protein